MSKNEDRPYRCACHNRDAHLFCPALRLLRNFAMATGRCHMANGRLVAGPRPSKNIRVSKKGRK